MAGSSLRRSTKRRVMADINVVPYIDVMLVLLVIFMVTAPMVNPGVVNLPTVGGAKVQSLPPVFLTIDANGPPSYFALDKRSSSMARTISPSLSRAITLTTPALGESTEISHMLESAESAKYS